jgi:hypothetical protein
MKFQLILFSFFTCLSLNGFAQSNNNINDTATNNKAIPGNSVNPNGNQIKTPQNNNDAEKRKKLAEAILQQAKAKHEQTVKKTIITQEVINNVLNNGVHYPEPTPEVKEFSPEPKKINQTDHSKFFLLNILFKKLDEMKRPVVISNKGTWQYLNSTSELIAWFLLSRLLPIIIILGIFYKVFEFLKLGERIAKVSRIYKESMKNASIILEERNNNYSKTDKFFKGTQLFIVQVFKEIFVI